MRVLVIGAGGFVGRHVVAALKRGGHDVVGTMRHGTLDPPIGLAAVVEGDLLRDLDPSDWRPRLLGIDAVVNAAGILRERRQGDFERVHRLAPRALFEACASAGVRRIVQISAIGDPTDGAFVASKHALDADLATLDLDWTVLRPSLVYSAAGSYGGSSLLRALAAAPWVTPLPGDGNQRLQPIAAEDLGRAVVTLLETGSGVGEVLDAVGPETLPIRDYLAAWRAWLRFRPARPLQTPMFLMHVSARCADVLVRGPLGSTMLRMLERGNISTPERSERFQSVCGFAPHSLGEMLAASPSAVQDRWHARLYALRPLMLMTLAALWVASGVVGILLPDEVSAEILVHLGLEPATLRALVWSASALDIAVGVALLIPSLSRAALWLALAMLGGYTIGLGLLQPQLWLDPAGGLLKNLALAPMVLALLVTGERR